LTVDVPEGVVLREEEPIARHLALRASPGSFERWAEVETEADLVAVVRAARAEKLAIRVVHPFADALPPEGGIGGLGLRLGGAFEQFTEHDDGTVTAGVSVPVARLSTLPGFGAWGRASGAIGDALSDGWIVPAVVRCRRFRGRSFETVEGAGDADPKALPVALTLRRGTSHAGILAGTAWAEPGRRTPGLRAVLQKSGLGPVRLHDAVLAEDDPAVLLNRGRATPRELRLLLTAVKDKVRIATGLELQERLFSPGRGGRLG
jgi:hypothetical protein